jgi:hypothetical protein
VFWTGQTITADMLANGKVFRQIISKGFKPNCTFTSSMEQFNLGRVTAPILVFGDHPSATVNRTLVKYFFGKLTIKFSVIGRC